MKKTGLLMAVALLTATPLAYAEVGADSPAAVGKPDAKGLFCVYVDKSAPENHFFPSGWMGDVGDLKVNDADKSNPKNGTTSYKISYSAKGSSGAGWAGIYWQQPSNNWGTKPGGWDLSRYRRLTFWARSEKGGQKINEFKMGGISGDYGDSDSASIGPVTLTKEWQKFTINLADKNLSHVIGGFGFAVARDKNPNGVVMYLDDIRYEP